MNLLAHMVQVAILAGALLGVVVLGVGTVVADYLCKVAADNVCDWCGGGGCDECDPAAARPDPGAEQDRARDRWIDGQLGVA